MQFTCPTCGATVRVAVIPENREAVCPRCGTFLRLGESADEQAGVHTGDTSERSRMRLIVAGGAVIVAMALLAAGGFVWNNERKKHPPPPAKKLTREEEQQRQEEIDEQLSGIKLALWTGGLVVAWIVVFALWVLMLAWTARDALNRSFGDPATWTIFLLFTGPIGLVVYLFARPGGRLHACPSCSRAHLSYVSRCPHCGRSLEPRKR